MLQCLQSKPPVPVDLCGKSGRPRVPVCGALACIKCACKLRSHVIYCSETDRI